MKCFIAILLLALFAVAFAQANPIEPERSESAAPIPDAPRDKRGALLTYSYTPYLPYAYRTIPYYSYYL